MITFIEQSHYIVSFILLGLIWTIQLVHYPSFVYVSSERFIDFEKMHTFKISLVVMPLMIIELITALSMLYLNSMNVPSMAYTAIIVFIWLSTFTFSVPCHKKLYLGKDIKIIKKLISTNWIRTILWSIKASLLCYFS